MSNDVIHYRSIIEFAEIPGYNDLSGVQKDVFGKVFSTARSAHANEEGQLIIDWIRVRAEKLSAQNLGTVLGLLGTIDGLSIETINDKEVRNATLVRAIPEDIKEQLSIERKIDNHIRSVKNQQSEHIFSDWSNQHFGK